MSALIRLTMPLFMLFLRITVYMLRLLFLLAFFLFAVTVLRRRPARAIRFPRF